MTTLFIKTVSGFEVWERDFWGNMTRPRHVRIPREVIDCFDWHHCSKVEWDGFTASPVWDAPPARQVQTVVVEREVPVYRDRYIGRRSSSSDELAAAAIGTGLGMLFGAALGMAGSRPSSSKKLGK